MAAKLGKRPPSSRLPPSPRLRRTGRRSPGRLWSDKLAGLWRDESAGRGNRKLERGMPAPGFFAVFSGIPSIGWNAAIGFANPGGIEALSPGLRGTSYPGSKQREITTLKELNPFRKSLIFNPFRVVILARDYPGLASRNRPNPGLNDPIPSGLTQGSCQYIKEQSNAVPPKTARSPNLEHTRKGACGDCGGRETATDLPQKTRAAKPPPHRFGTEANEENTKKRSVRKILSETRGFFL
jgi:hypothetical protein